jgi:hypothetical protein
MRRGFVSEGDVRLPRADVAGNLECDGSRFGGVLYADGAKIGGAVFLRAGFRAERGVRLLGAHIGQDLDCHGGQFTNTAADAYALSCDRAKIDGGVLMNKGFKSEGEVRFPSAHIGGNLDCTGAQLAQKIKDRVSLNLSAATIEGDAFLRNGFKSEGRSVLTQVTIKGDLDCGNAWFINTNGLALEAAKAKVEGNVFLHNNFKADGEVELLFVDIGANLICSGGSFVNPGGYAISADGARVGGSVLLRDGFSAKGEVRLPRAVIGADLACNGAELRNFVAKGFALNAQGATIQGIAFLSDGFSAIGGVDFAGAKIGLILECTGGRFQNDNTNGNAINLALANILGGVQFGTNSAIEGMLNCLGADLGRLLLFQDIENSGRMTLDLRYAKVGTLRDSPSSWPNLDHLLLDGFIYDRIAKPGPLDAKSRLDWLNRQAEAPFLPQPYEQLASVLRNMGNDDDAKMVLIAKNERLAQACPLFSAAGLWYHVLGPIVAYGYKPMRALWLSLVGIVCGTIVFGWAKKRGLIRPADDEKAYPKQDLESDRRLASDHPGFVAWIYAIETFVPLVSFDMAQHWRPYAYRNAKLRLGPFQMPVSGRYLLGFLVCYKIAGWTLAALWIGALSGLIKT